MAYLDRSKIIMQRKNWFSYYYFYFSCPTRVGSFVL